MTERAPGVFETIGNGRVQDGLGEVEPFGGTGTFTGGIEARSRKTQADSRRVLNDMADERHFDEFGCILGGAA